MQKKDAKTYNSRYSLVVTHPTTNLPICGLCMAERTGCPFFHSLWSYVVAMVLIAFIYHDRICFPSERGLGEIGQPPCLLILLRTFPTTTYRIHYRKHFLNQAV
jgi:hypothetical protein